MRFEQYKNRDKNFIAMMKVTGWTALVLIIINLSLDSYYWDTWTEILLISFAIGTSVHGWDILHDINISRNDNVGKVLTILAYIVKGIISLVIGIIVYNYYVYKELCFYVISKQTYYRNSISSSLPFYLELTEAILGSISGALYVGAYMSIFNVEFPMWLAFTSCLIPGGIGILSGIRFYIKNNMIEKVIWWIVISILMLISVMYFEIFLDWLYL